MFRKRPFYGYSCLKKKKKVTMYAFGAMFSADFKSMRTFDIFKANLLHLINSRFNAQK